MPDTDLVGKVDRPPTLTQAVADKIRDGIFSGILSPGAPLHEVELAKSLEASRGTVREALRRLQEEEGLVEVLTHRGAFVTRLTPRRAREIYTLRALLEPYAVRLAAESHAYTEPCLAELEALADRIAQLLSGGDLYETLTADMEFHRLVCERSNHRLLLQTLQGLRSQTLLFMLNTKLHAALVSADNSHRAVVAAIRSGDAARAEETIRRHITEAGVLLSKRLDEIDSQGMAAS